MIDPKARLFRWGPIPGRLISISHWTAIYYWYPKRLHKYIWPEGYVLFYKNKMLFTNEMKGLENIGGRVFREIILTNKIKKTCLIWQKNLLNLFAFCKKISTGYLANLSSAELLKKWTQLNNLIYSFWEVGIIPELGAYGGPPILKNALGREKISENKKREFFSALSAPTKLSFYQDEEADLLKLIKKYKSKDFNLFLEKHREKYLWLENSYFRTRVLKKDFFLKRIREKIRQGVKPNREISKMGSGLKITKQNKLKILAKLGNKKEIKRISDGLAVCIGWQDQRKKYIFQYLHYIDLFLAEFARRAQLPLRIFDFAWPEEVNVRPSRNLVKLLGERSKNCFVIHFNRNKRKCLYGKNARKIFRIFWLEKTEIKENRLEGLMVYSEAKPIIGKVYVIKKASDIKKFPKGRVLVATMTAPEYITAIRKAKAIVTDTGGITCHAAIVARELKVTCIVGTKTATKLFKNGDIIRLDANKGIVKKL